MRKFLVSSVTALLAIFVIGCSTGIAIILEMTISQAKNYHSVYHHGQALFHLLKSQV